MRAVDSNAGDDPEEINHKDSVDWWHSADVGRLFGCGLCFSLQAQEFCDSERGIELDKVEEGELEVEAGYLFFKQWLSKLILTVVKYVLNKLQQLMKQSLLFSCPLSASYQLLLRL